MKFTLSQNQFMRSSYRLEREIEPTASADDIKRTMVRRTIEEIEELRRIERENMDAWGVES